MVNIAFRKGDSHACTFAYNGCHMLVPYELNEKKSGAAAPEFQTVDKGLISALSDMGLFASVKDAGRVAVKPGFVGIATKRYAHKP